MGTDDRRVRAEVIVQDNSTPVTSRDGGLHAVTGDGRVKSRPLPMISTANVQDQQTLAM